MRVIYSHFILLAQLEGMCTQSTSYNNIKYCIWRVGVLLAVSLRSDYCNVISNVISTIPVCKYKAPNSLSRVKISLSRFFQSTVLFYFIFLCLFSNIVYCFLL